MGICPMAEPSRRSPRRSAGEPSQAAGEQPKQRPKPPCANRVPKTSRTALTTPTWLTHHAPPMGPEQLVSDASASATVTVTVTAFSLNTAGTQLQLAPKQNPSMRKINRITSALLRLLLL